VRVVALRQTEVDLEEFVDGNERERKESLGGSEWELEDK